MTFWIILQPYCQSEEFYSLKSSNSYFENANFLFSSPYGGGRGRGRGNKHSGSGSMRSNNTPVELSITGYEGGTQEDLLAFLKRKAHRPIVISNIRYESGTMFFEVEHMGQAKTLQKLSGIRFAGSQLFIKIKASSMETDSGSSQVGSTIETLRTFLTSRYVPEHKYLNLENMDGDPIIRRAKIRGIGTAGPNSNIGPAIFKLTSEMFPDVQSVSLASNRIRNLSPLTTMSHFLPHIQNISLKDNSIHQYRDLDSLSGSTKLKELKELVLLGNPLRDNEVKKSGDDSSYRSEITRRFPFLKVLDQIPVGPTIQFDVSEVESVATGDAVLPAPIQKGFVDSEGTNAMVTDFLTRYFNLYDNNRQTLLDIYDEDSVFSYMVNVTYPPRQRRTSTKNLPDWSQYISSSRNLSRVKDLTKRTASLNIGAIAIVNALAQLPSTQHPIQDQSKFCYDTWQLPQVPSGAAVIFIVIHGEFTEGTEGIERSFDRTFMIAPPTPGSKAHQSGLPYVIRSDQLSIRHHVNSQAWKVDVSSAPTPATMNPLSLPAAPAPGAPIQNISVDPMMAGLVYSSHVIYGISI
ncbi:nuclear mRNA export, poly(A)+RNA binding protein, variant 2 [Basidiobolus ranarum]|uniref:Nuclear mRNA export, poly(A)+RNA binding protein, variant 2 n=1 Tax=Basidiobolus ranarum TaxID=34480 RepID=A0ABR2VY82_9FUNG